MRDVAEIVMREIALRREIVRREHAEEQQNLLIGELHHRVKNTLTVVQSLITLSLRSAEDFETFGNSITSRIASLAKTHTLLVDRQWHTVSLRELLTSEYGPYAEGERITLDGPEVSLPSQIAVGIGMALHELITNAIKYGSLSVPAGRVSLTWTTQQNGAETKLALTWVESGGPPVAPPKRRGFGTILLERLLGPQIEGAITTDFAPEGLRVRIDSIVSQADR
jgi:two-component sensor histidine kinase